MADRFFEINKDGAPHIACSACSAVEQAGRASRHGKNLPPEAITKFLRNKGWTVGSTPRKDLCPACTATARKTAMKETSVPHDTKVVEIKPKLNGISELPPREMTREDRRIVFAKIEEVYLDETTGYIKDWNDERVAKDLSCPRKWVETIRDENFGPAHAALNPQVLVLLDEIDGAVIMVNKIATDTAEFNKKVNDMVTEAATLNTRASTILTQVQTLRAELKKITGR